MTEIGIISIGTANPRYMRSQAEIAELIAIALNLKPVARKILKSVYKATGISQRYSVISDYCKSPGNFEFFPNSTDEDFPRTSARMKIYRENPLGLALSAIKNCLSLISDFKINKITHLITVSCTGMYAPGIDIEIVNELNLNSSIERTAINFMGCYGAINALKVANSICKSEPGSIVLIVSVELCSIHFQKNMDIDNIIANSIFSDGAAAILIQSEPKYKKYFTLESFYNDLLPNTNKEMAWNIGDQGFDIALSTYVPAILESVINNFILKSLSQYGLTLADVDLFAIHPGGFKILEACEKALSITKEDNRYSYLTLRNFGNMSSATILFVLKAIWDDVGLQDHQKNILSCAFGPGLTLESMRLKTNCI